MILGLLIGIFIGAAIGVLILGLFVSGKVRDAYTQGRIDEVCDGVLSGTYPDPGWRGK